VTPSLELAFSLTFDDRAMWSTPALLRHQAEVRPDRPFLQWMANRPLTFGTVHARVARTATRLREQGVGPGDTVALFLPNGLAYVLYWLALNALGAVEVPVNVHYRGTFLQHVLNDSGATTVVTDGRLLDAVLAAAAGLAHLERAFVVGGPGSRPASGPIRLVDADVLEASAPLPDGATWWSGLDGGPQDPSAPATVMYTSGTTGRSKGVVMPHSHLYLFGEEGANLVRLTEDDRYYNPFPLFHGNAQMLTVYPCLIRGACAVLYPEFSASQWLSHIRDNRVTVTNLIGATMEFVWRQPRRDDDADNELRVIECAPVATANADGFRSRFGVDELVESFGQTETGLTILCPYGRSRPVGSVGVALEDWFEVGLVDPDTDRAVPVGDVGELVVRPREPGTICQGYLGNDRATLDASRNLWWHTGDLLWRDEDGWYFFVDRVKDAIRVRGENVSSFEVEEVLGSYPGVAECAAVAVRSDLSGGEDEIKACVVMTSGEALDPADLIRHCAERSPYFAVPRYVEVLDALPRTASEKIRKVELRDAGVGPGTWDRVVAGIDPRVLTGERRVTRQVEAGTGHHEPDRLETDPDSTA
jgi:crotonobetaine/carnitine-CoA ligase